MLFVTYNLWLLPKETANALRKMSFSFEKDLLFYFHKPIIQNNKVNGIFNEITFKFKLFVVLKTEIVFYLIVFIYFRR